MIKRLVKLSLVFLIFIIFYLSVSYGSEEVNPLSGFAVKDYLSTPSDIILDSKVFDYLEVNKWVSIAVILHDNSNISYNSDIKANKMIFRRKADLFEEAEDNVISTLSEKEFNLTYKFTSFNGFAGYITIEGLEKLANNPIVKKIELNGKYKLSLSESVPLINADHVWKSTINNNNITGVSQTVCIIDSGINSSHPALTNNVLYEKCFCDYGSGGYGCCPNGLIEDENTEDSTGHGTHVAGIVAANGSLKGVAPDSMINSFMYINLKEISGL